MTETPQEWNGSAHSTAHRACHLEDSLEQQLLMFPEPLHYNLLDYFCCLNFSQRRNFILETLGRIGIKYRILRTENAFHIVVKPDYQLEIQPQRLSDHNKLFQAKCFIAHYDRRLQTPGANDNSAAVWHLLNLAAQMKREQPVIKTPMQIIFTDHEELRSKEHINEQGAYMLAQNFRKRNPKLRYVFFVFDQCGIGDTLCYLPNIISNKKLQLRQEQIFNQIQEDALFRIPIAKILKYQYYFSDNLGLNLWDYPALLFSTLPQNDIKVWQQSGKKPKSWQSIHTQGDTPDLLEARSFTLMNQVLSRLLRS